MREVAAAAGVSLGTLTYHFTGIDEVLAGVIEAEETQFFHPIVVRALDADTGRAGLRCCALAFRAEGRDIRGGDTPARSAATATGGTSLP